MLGLLGSGSVLADRRVVFPSAEHASCNTEALLGPVIGAGTIKTQLF